jgi:chromosome segregation ATPase
MKRIFVIGISLMTLASGILFNSCANTQPLKDSTSDLAAQNVELESKLSGASEQNTKLQADLDKANQKIAGLQADLNQANQDNKTAQANLAQAQKNIDTENQLYQDAVKTQNDLQSYQSQLKNDILLTYNGQMAAFNNFIAAHPSGTYDMASGKLAANTSNPLSSDDKACVEVWYAQLAALKALAEK